MTEHENWIRLWSVDQSARINRFSSTEKVIDDARKIVSFVLDKPMADIIKIVTDRIP